MNTQTLEGRAAAALAAPQRILPGLVVLMLLTILLAFQHTAPAPVAAPALPTVSLAIARGAELAETPASAYNQPQVVVLGAEHFLVSVVTTEMNGAETIPAAPVSISRDAAGWQICYTRVPLEALTATATPVRLEFEVRGTLGNAAVNVAACADQPPAAAQQPASRRPG